MDWTLPFYLTFIRESSWNQGLFYRCAWWRNQGLFMWLPLCVCHRFGKDCALEITCIAHQLMSWYLGAWPFSSQQRRPSFNLTGTKHGCNTIISSGRHHFRPHGQVVSKKCFKCIFSDQKNTCLPASLTWYQSKYDIFPRCLDVIMNKYVQYFPDVSMPSLTNMYSILGVILSDVFSTRKTIYNWKATSLWHPMPIFPCPEASQPIERISVVVFLRWFR
jgi:hypothetical protein